MVGTATDFERSENDLLRWRPVGVLADTGRSPEGRSVF
jgi:hypothetical protein